MILLKLLALFVVANTIQATLNPDNNIRQGDYIQLQVVPDDCNHNEAPFLIASGERLLASEVEGKAFEITNLTVPSNRFQLRSLGNSYWVAANDSGNSNVIVSKTIPLNSGWETFVFEKVGNGQIRIKTTDQKKVYYWSANTVRHHNTAIYANVTNAGKCETFNVYRCQKVYDGYCIPSVSDRYWGPVFKDNEVDNGEGIMTVDADMDQVCAARCHAQPGCTAWVRQPSMKAKNCILTKKGTGYKAAFGRNAGPGANFWYWYAWDTQKAIPTYKDPVQTSVTTENACSNRCSMNSGCVAWSRDIKTNTCRLYRFVGNPVSDPNSHCGIRTLPMAPMFYNSKRAVDSGSVVNVQGHNGLWWRIDRENREGIIELVEHINPYDAQYQFYIEKPGEDKVSIQSKANGLWLRANLTTYSTRFSAKSRGDSETWSFQRFTMPGINREQVQLKTSDGRRWLTLSDSPKNDIGPCQTSKANYPVSCTSVAALTSEKPDHMERFNIMLPPNPIVRMRPDNSLTSGEYYQIQASNGLWWQVDDGNPGIVKLVEGVNPNEAGRWFMINNWGTGKVQIQSRKTGRWLQVLDNGGSTARFDSTDSLQQYSYQQLDDGKNKQVRFKTNGETYWLTLAHSYSNDGGLCSEQASSKNCTSINARKADEPGEWETFNLFTFTDLYGNNLGSWLDLERWMNSDVFVNGSWMGAELSTGNSTDEWTWCEQQTAFAGRANGTIARAVHWDNQITDRDFAWMAAHKINTVRIPVGYWLTLSEEELNKRGFPFYRGGVTRLDRAFEVAASYGIWVIISMHAAYGSQNGWWHSGREGLINFGTGTTVQDTANFVKTLVIRYGCQPNFYGIGVINEPRIAVWNDNKTPVPVPALREYLRLTSEHLRTFAPYAINFLPNGFQDDRIAEFAPPFTGSEVFETHPYREWDQNGFDLTEQMNRLKGAIASAKLWAKTVNYWTFVGECSNSANDTVFRGLSVSQSFYVRRLYGVTQVDIFAKRGLNLGLTFWPYKITGENYGWNAWSFRQSIEEQTWPDFYVRT